MPPRLLLVTSRAEKAEEAARLGFPVERVDLDLPEPQALDPGEIVEAKAHDAFARLRAPVLVEDSGLSIAAWNGFPGALVKWMERTVGLDGIARMLDAFADRRAVAVCVVASFDGEHLRVARGETPGSIAASPRGTRGFGWDRLFVPEGATRTFAEMSPEEKDRVSHRRRAWDELARCAPELSRGQ